MTEHESTAVGFEHAGPRPEPETSSPWRRKLSAAGAAVLAVLAKLKAILLVLGNIKIFATAGTMVVSVLAYGTIWGIPFAAGFLGLVALAIVFPNPIILIIVVFAAIETHRRWQARRSADAEQRAYYKVAPVDRVLVGAVYLSLVALLVVGMHATNLNATFA
jgi:hypothetical protein